MKDKLIGFLYRLLALIGSYAIYFALGLALMDHGYSEIQQRFILGPVILGLILFVVNWRPR